VPNRPPTGQLVHRLLVVVSVAAALFTIALARGGFRVDLGPLRLSSHASPATPLIIALVTGLGAWALRLARNPGPAVPAAGILRRARWALLVSALVVGLNSFFMLAPPPAPGTNNCVYVRPLGGGFTHILNCDAPEFVLLAHTPWIVLTREHAARQNRPLSFTLAYALATPMRQLGWFDWFFQPDGPEFVAYAAINVVALVLAVGCFASLLTWSGGGSSGMELFFVTIVLTGNEVTKLFFLSPHVQVFNLLIPCLALYASARLIGRGRALSTAEALLLGVAFGVGLLIYASFAIALLCVAAIQLLVYRRPVSAGSMVLVAGAIFGCWALFVYLRTGFYYNYEVAEFRQFVWIVDCVRQGRAQCALDVSRKASDFMGATAPVLALPMALIVVVWLARRALSTAPPASDHAFPDAFRGAIAVNFVVTTIFLALMGYYRTRLSWLLVPALLLLAALQLQRLRWAMGEARTAWFNAAVVVATVLYMAQLVFRAGPFS